MADYARRLAAALPERYEAVAVALPEVAQRSAWRQASAAARDADVVHVHYEYGLFHTVKPYRNRFADFLSGIDAPVVVTLHDLLPRLVPQWRRREPPDDGGARRTEKYGVRSLARDIAYLPFFRGWERSLYELAEHWVVHSDEQRRAVELHTDAARVTHLLHPIAVRSALWSERWSAESRRPSRLVTPGFVKAHKGLEDLARAVAGLPNVSWLIAGGSQDAFDERTRRQLEQVIERLGIGDRVDITGYLSADEMDRRLRESDVAVFPYRRAAGSGSVSWAIALGMPVLTSNLVAFRELADAGAGVMPCLECGGSEDGASLRPSLGEALQRPHALRELGEANRRFAQANSYSRAADRLASVFDSLIEARAG